MRVLPATVISPLPVSSVVGLPTVRWPSTVLSPSVRRSPATVASPVPVSSVVGAPSVRREPVRLEELKSPVNVVVT